ncbi:putative EG45-like domain containing protein 1 [Abeliophyllum distichum]|uniref:EG45-like domain containing protein 1 n=1 Tax=Abeliophyllum distichum TaxID=126358 RepID=A0ABD1QYS0_9LAMI
MRREGMCQLVAIGEFLLSIVESPSLHTICTKVSSTLASACYGFQDQGTLIAAANPSLFNNRAACGSRCRVRCTAATNAGIPQPCTGNEVTVTIVDLCPGCGPNQLDLSRRAFSRIAYPDAGRIRIDYTRV